MTNTVRKKVSYAELNKTITELDGQISASETHGLLSGIFCLSPTIQESVWHTILIENLDCNEPLKRQWKIFDKVAAQIIDDFSKKIVIFSLMLPDDESSMDLRTEALGGWCRGYLSGLALVGIGEEDLKNAVVSELVQDISQISQISSETADAEEDEANYMELVEYLRIAVQNIQLELRGAEKESIH
jgi:yecA family protein